MSAFRTDKYPLFAFASACLLTCASAKSAVEIPEEVRVIGITPGGMSRQELTKVPYALLGASQQDLQSSEVLDLSEFMNQRLASVSINSAQNNPLQPDLNFRGFTASPLLGLPQGLSVYQNGARINEPLGDAVNWDLLPESAIARVELISGSNPVFGLNTLGGALSLTMKNGFSFPTFQAEATAGSWDRVTASIEKGWNNGTWAYYLNLNSFDEAGWRDLSQSDALNGFASISWRDEERSSLNLGLQAGDSHLIGNGALPLGMLTSNRSDVFTAPDITDNEMHMLLLDASHALSANVRVSGNLNWRSNDTHSFNGDSSDFRLCHYASGEQALLNDADELETDLEDVLDIELDDICAGKVAGIGNSADLQALIAERALLAGLDANMFNLQDITDEFSGSGPLNDEAINNMSDRHQESRSFDLQLDWTGELFGRSNQLVSGIGYYDGESTFQAILELAELDPLTRSTWGRGTGAFWDEAVTDIATSSRTGSFYISNTTDLNEQLALTLSGRFNRTRIDLEDQSGLRPELNGSHLYTRFNPAVGLAWNPDESVTLFASYSRSSRVPTPIELACNEHIFELARQYAEHDGENPDEIEFECRLPNAFLADPHLEDVVTSTLELGARGTISGIEYQLGLFDADNHNDIIFQTTGRSTGLFGNVDMTQRRGVEITMNGSLDRIDWYVGITHVKATFEDNFLVLSPNHPAANEDGEVMVSKGKQMPGLPQNLIKLGGDFYFTESLSAGLDLLHNSSQFLRGDEANYLEKVDGFSLLNLRVNYRLAEHFVMFGRMTNVLDESYENFGLIGEDPSEVLPWLTDNRPYFLGVGSPRAGWLGMRYSF